MQRTKKIKARWRFFGAVSEKYYLAFILVQTAAEPISVSCCFVFSFSVRKKHRTLQRKVYCVILYMKVCDTTYL
jgi:hypothetical protein